MRIYEQVDKHGDKFIYSWIWDAPYNYKHKVEQEGWKWIRGKPRGCYVTNDPDVAKRTRMFYNAQIYSNDTHQVHNAPLLLAVPKAS